MRNISFKLTTDQFRQRTKTVTRRLGWLHVQPGDRLMGCEKCQGLKRGEPIVRLGEIELVTVRRESLLTMSADREYGAVEARREGFPGMSGAEFVRMFCKHMGCDPTTTVTRLEFRYLDRSTPDPKPIATDH